MRMHADGSLSRLAALAAPDVTHPIAFSLLDDHSAPPAAHLYLVLSSNPPVMAHVDALTMQMLRKWELKEAGERQFGAGLVLPNGDLLMATLGERTNLHGESGATGAASAVIRLRPSHERDGKLLRMGEALLPVGDVSCAFLEPSQPDAAFFGTASSPARLMRLDTSKWPVKPLMASLELEISDGPIVSCALDSARRIAYLGLGGRHGKLIGVSVANGNLRRLPGFLRVPGHVVAASAAPGGGAPLFATSRRSAAALPEALFRSDAPADTADEQMVLRLDDASACGGSPGKPACSGRGSCADGRCVCLPGWQGAQCERGPVGCPNDCSGHGSCAAPGVCKCADGWGGVDCSAPSCLADCSGHGKCASPGVCECFEGYAGATCDVAQCANGCSGHGSCERPGECTCAVGWGGHDCSEPQCEAGCHGHGACTAPGSCACYEGWSGANCDVAVCQSGCSGHGRCSSPGSCRWARAGPVKHARFRSARTRRQRPVRRPDAFQPQQRGSSGSSSGGSAPRCECFLAGRAIDATGAAARPRARARVPSAGASARASTCAATIARSRTAARLDAQAVATAPLLWPIRTAGCSPSELPSTFLRSASASTAGLARSARSPHAFAAWLRRPRQLRQPWQVRVRGRMEWSQV